MAIYTEPPAVVTGQTMTATNWNAWVRTNFQAVWPFTTAGDLAYASAANQLSRLGIGAAGQILRTTGTLPAWEGMRGARVKRTTGQSIANVSYTAATFSSEDFDVGGFWVIGSPSRFTIPRAGYYLVGGKIGWDNNPTNVRELKIYVNGSASNGYTESSQALSGIDTRMNISFPMYLSASDYLELYLWQNSGGSLSHGNDISYFWILDVGP